MESWLILKPCPQSLFKKSGVSILCWIKKMYAFVCDIPSTVTAIAIVPSMFGNMNIDNAIAI